MSSNIVFNGRVEQNRVEVVATGPDGARRQLQPPQGTDFAWGFMGTSVANLATAIAAELYPGHDGGAAASLIKRRFLTAIKRDEAWQLTGAEIRAYVDERLASQAAAGNRVSA